MRLIDADALCGWLKGAGSYLKGLENHKPLTKAIGVIINHTEAMPTIDAVEVVHGRWERYWSEEYWTHFHSCSICFGHAPIKEETAHDEVLSNYCPNCGAKMDLK